MAVSTRISLVRHGMVHNPDNIVYGRKPFFGLSREGVDDARRAARYLADKNLEALFAGPLLRTRQTAKHILKFYPNLELRLSCLLNEVHTPFEGRTETSLQGVELDFYRNKSPLYEQPGDVLNRVLKFIRRIRLNDRASHIAAVTHGDVIVFLTLWASRLEITAENKLNLLQTGVFQEYPRTGSVTTLSFRTLCADEIPSVTYTNLRNA